MGTYMGSINISIKDDAYRFLKTLKGKNESFSDVILRFKEEKKSDGKTLLRIIYSNREVLEGIDWEKRKKIMEDFRSSFNQGIEQRIKLRKNNK